LGETFSFFRPLNIDVDKLKVRASANPVTAPKAWRLVQAKNPAIAVHSTVPDSASIARPVQTKLVNARRNSVGECRKVFKAVASTTAGQYRQ